jgi:hypothetical protein
MKLTLTMWHMASRYVPKSHRHPETFESLCKRLGTQLWHTYFQGLISLGVQADTLGAVGLSGSETLIPMREVDRNRIGTEVLNVLVTLDEVDPQ